VPEPFRILTVCIGNVCRSPLAERLLVKELAEAGEAFEVSSAGIGAMVGHAMEPHAVEQLEALGGDPSGFVARQLEPGLVDAADLVLTATVGIRQRVLQEAPGGLRRTFTLREFAALVEGVEASSLEELVADAARRRGSVGHGDLDVPDPMGRSAEVHVEAASLAAEAVAVAAGALVSIRLA
jgi:protein-tyrosine phosphatase